MASFISRSIPCCWGSGSRINRQGSARASKSWPNTDAQRVVNCYVGTSVLRSWPLDSRGAVHLRFQRGTKRMTSIPRGIALPNGWEAETFQDWAIPEEVLDQWKTLARHEGDLGVF